MFYSTHACYLQALSEVKITRAQKYGEFLPLAVKKHGYWTGYYTSRPAMKGLFRRTSSLLQVFRIFGPYSFSS